MTDPVTVPPLAEVVAVAERHLRPLGHRWIHTQAVAGRAAELSVTVDETDRQLLVAAAWWHDIGYGDAQHHTWLHPLDGARWVSGEKYPVRLCALVAHHSAATYEAQLRGLAAELSGPVGQRVDYAERLAEILRRYPPGSAVAEAMTAAQPAIAAAIARVMARSAH